MRNETGEELSKNNEQYFYRALARRSRYSLFNSVCLYVCASYCGNLSKLMQNSLNLSTMW